MSRRAAARPGAMAEAVAAGFRSVINNRPDFEGGPDQPTSAAWKPRRAPPASSRMAAGGAGAQRRRDRPLRRAAGNAADADPGVLPLRRTLEQALRRCHRSTALILGAPLGRRRSRRRLDRMAHGDQGSSNRALGRDLGVTRSADDRRRDVAARRYIRRRFAAAVPRRLQSRIVGDAVAPLLTLSRLIDRVHRMGRSLGRLARPRRRADQRHQRDRAQGVQHQLERVPRDPVVPVRRGVPARGRLHPAAPGARQDRRDLGPLLQAHADLDRRHRPGLLRAAARLHGRSPRRSRSSSAPTR